MCPMQAKKDQTQFPDRGHRKQKRPNWFPLQAEKTKLNSHRKWKDQANLQ